MNNKCIIIVPVYRTQPNELECLSLKQLDNIVNEYNICLIGCDRIDYESYKKLFINNKPINKSFDDKFFESNKSYSQLCLNYDFYKTFENYEYMMIYQTDCWIFRNEIKKFCDMGYDYIGGPIYSAGSKWPNFKICARPVVGNGGLSLRKISTMMKITDREGPIYNKYKEEWNNVEYEDMFICDVISHSILMYIPSYEIAETFAVDTLPLYIKTINPMGAHRVFALYKYWQQIIPELNDEHIIKLSEEAYEAFKNMYK